MVVLQVLPVVIVVILWELFIRVQPRLEFFFGSPTEIAFYVVNKTIDGTLPRDALVTTVEAVSGFLAGNTIGTLLGVGLWYSRTAFVVARPYIIALGSAPIFALAPLLVVWFGTGMVSKVVIAALSTVFIALSQAYTGAEQTDKKYTRLMRTLGARKHDTFRKVVAPAALIWVVSGMRLNVGFALLGAFIGEFISSEHGLGHLILVASGLFDISLVLTGVFAFMTVALVLNWLISVSVPVFQRTVLQWL